MMPKGVLHLPRVGPYLPCIYCDSSVWPLPLCGGGVWAYCKGATERVLLEMEGRGV